MSRLNRSLLVSFVVVALFASTLLTGCGMFKKAPVLTQAQIMAGKIGKEHPVSQDQATKMGCSCHVEAAKKAAGQ
jgi:hypothetical protein